MPLNPQITPTIPFTKEAYDSLKIEKARLLQLRVEVSQRLKEAREQGDLKENEAYQYAKFELGNIGRQLRDINYRLQHGYVAALAAAGAATSAQFGTTITLKNLENNTELTFMLVSEFESNPAEKKLSTSSPIGAAALGKKLNEIIVVTTPNGPKTFQIVSIS